jgi:hypothetical protein
MTALRAASGARTRYLAAMAAMLPSIATIGCKDEPKLLSEKTDTATNQKVLAAIAAANDAAPPAADPDPYAKAALIEFCITESRHVGDNHADPPFEKCSRQANHPGALAKTHGVWGNFNVVATRAERTTYGNACCYEWKRNRPVGGRVLRDATGAPAVARIMTRRDWLLAAAEKISTAHLDDDMRAGLAEHWMLEAAAEHASVASFAQLTLDLMAFGAPPDLLADVQRAAIDEIEHAKIAFALATAFGGAAVGPTALAARPGACHTLADLARTTFTDACVNESAASAQLSERAREVSDPTLKQLFATMGADEERHAELAWRIVAWTLRSGDPEVVRALANARDEVIDELLTLTHEGVATTTRDELRAMVLREIVLPCLIALLDAHEAALTRVSIDAQC